MVQFLGAKAKCHYNSLTNETFKKIRVHLYYFIQESFFICQGSVKQLKRSVKNMRFSCVWKVLVIEKLCCTHDEGKGAVGDWEETQGRSPPLWPALCLLLSSPLSLVRCLQPFSPKPPVPLLSSLPGSGLCFSNTFSFFNPNKIYSL